MRLLVLTMLLLGLDTIRAQENLSKEPIRLSLAQTLVLASTQNPDLRVLDQSIETARASVVIAGQRPNPNISLGVPIGPAERKQRLGFHLPLELGGRRQARLAVAEGVVREAELNREQSRLLLLNQARNAFVESVIAEATLDQSRNDLILYERVVDFAQRRFDAGDIAEAELIRANFEREQIKRTFYPAENRVAASRLTLNRLLGHSLDTRVEIVSDEAVFPTESLLASPAWQLPELESLQTMARDRRPDLALVAQQTETARRRVELARANQAPDFSIQGTAMYDPVYPAFTYQVGVQMEILTGDDRSGQVQQARSMEQEALLRQQATLAAADYAVALAWTNYQNARSQLINDLQVLKPQADEVLNLAEKMYELGQGDMNQLLISGQAVQRLRQAFLTDVTQLHRALGELELAVNSSLTGAY